MGAAVDIEDVVVEVFNPEAEPGHAHGADGVQFLFGQGAGFGLEGDLLHLIPRHAVLEVLGQLLQLRHGQITGGAAAEIDELGFPALEIVPPGIHFEFLHPGADVTADFVRSLVGIDPEIAEVATLPAEGDVEINPHR